MKLFLDVDALHKLAGYNLLDEALRLLGVSRDEVWVLPTARFKLRLKTREAAVKRHGADAADRLLAFIAAVRVTPDAPSEADSDLMGTIPGIDSGELILIPLAARAPDSILLTGDKKALRALATEQRCATFATLLARRVVCVEQVLLALMGRHDFRWLHERVRAAPGIDGGIAMVVTPSMSASEANARQGLNSCIESLRAETGALLLPALT